MTTAHRTAGSIILAPRLHHNHALWALALEYIRVHRREDRHRDSGGGPTRASGTDVHTRDGRSALPNSDGSIAGPRSALAGPAVRLAETCLTQKLVLDGDHLRAEGRLDAVPVPREDDGGPVRRDSRAFGCRRCFAKPWPTVALWGAFFSVPRDTFRFRGSTQVTHATCCRSLHCAPRRQMAAPRSRQWDRQLS